MIAILRTSIVLLFIFTIITGIVYPVALTGISQAVFPEQANGSLIFKEGKPVGSLLIGQPFNDPRYFLARPSSTKPFPYNAASSAGSNLSQGNPALLEAVSDRVAGLQAADPSNRKDIPVDLVTSSSSGLDPHISPAAAEYQVQRIAKEWSMTEEDIRTVVLSCTEDRQFGILGEPRVNVLCLNISLDELK